MHLDTDTQAVSQFRQTRDFFCLFLFEENKVSKAPIDILC